eukprot:14039501-Ditylum_brightwellii.AAC.1
MDITMDNYLNSQLKKFNNVHPKTKQHAPYKCNPQFGKDSQEPMEDDNTPKLDKKHTKRIQQIIGALLWYGRNVDITILKALGSLAAQQNTQTEQKKRQYNSYWITAPHAPMQKYGITHQT